MLQHKIFIRGYHEMNDVLNNLKILMKWNSRKVEFKKKKPKKKYKQLISMHLLNLINN